MKGSDVFMKMNPPPILDTIQSFYIRNFMTLLSEVNDRNLPVTRVMIYAQIMGMEDVMFFTDVMMECYAIYFSGIEKMYSKKKT
jgi:hypothetical protein